MNDIIREIPEGKRDQFQAIISEGQHIARSVHHASLDMADIAACISVTAIAMHRASWLRSLDILKELQNKVENLPFNRDNVFSSKMDEVLHSMKDSRATLGILGIYAHPNRRRIPVLQL